MKAPKRVPGNAASQVFLQNHEKSIISSIGYRIAFSFILPEATTGTENARRAQQKSSSLYLKRYEWG